MPNGSKYIYSNKNKQTSNTVENSSIFCLIGIIINKQKIRNIYLKSNTRPELLAKFAVSC